MEFSELVFQVFVSLSLGARLGWLDTPYDPALSLFLEALQAFLRRVATVGTGDSCTSGARGSSARSSDRAS